MVRYASTVASAAALALVALLATAPAHAAIQGTVVIQSDTPQRGYQPGYTAYEVIPAPPPPRREAQPRPRRGQIWVQGHWEWRGQRHAWVPGQWIQARPGHHYRQPQWDQRDGRWLLQRGGWDRGGDGRDGGWNRDGGGRDHDGGGWNRDGGGRDRDGDGVPNRYDSRPDNPRRN